MYLRQRLDTTGWIRIYGEFACCFLDQKKSTLFGFPLVEKSLRERRSEERNKRRCENRENREKRAKQGINGKGYSILQSVLVFKRPMTFSKSMGILGRFSTKTKEKWY